TRRHTISAGLRIRWNRPGDGTGCRLPAGLAQAGNVAVHGRLGQHVAAQAELAVHRARAARQGAARGVARRRGVARKLLQLHGGVHLLFVARRLAADDLLERLALGGELLRQLRALRFAVDHCGLGHGLLSGQLRNGKRNASSSARASSLVLAVVVMAMSMPRSASTWSKSISGKMICSLT